MDHDSSPLDHREFSVDPGEGHCNGRNGRASACGPGTGARQTADPADIAAAGSPGSASAAADGDRDESADGDRDESADGDRVESADGTAGATMARPSSASSSAWRPAQRSTL